MTAFRMALRCIILLYLVIGWGSQVFGSALQSPAYLEKWVSSHIHQYAIPGLSVAVIRDGKISTVFTYGYSDYQHRRKVTPNTKFQAASIAKPVSATAVAIIFAQHKYITVACHYNGSIFCFCPLRCVYGLHPDHGFFFNRI